MVRKTTKTTLTLIILAIGIALLMRWCGTLSGEFFYKMELLLNSKGRIGGFHSFLISISFWLLLIAAGIEAVFREKNGFYVFGSFAAPIFFSLSVAAWGLAATSTRVNVIWFWLFYYAGLIICIRIAYGRLSSIKGAAPSKLKQLFTNPPSKNVGDISLIDRSVLYVTQIVMLTAWFALLISTIVFCIQYKQIFGL